MKAIYVTYSKLISLGNYENKKIEIQLEVEAGEKASDVLAAAKKFVDTHLEKDDIKQNNDILKAQRIVDDEENYTIKQVKEAKELLKRVDETDNDLPF